MHSHNSYVSGVYCTLEIVVVDDSYKKQYIILQKYIVHY